MSQKVLQKYTPRAEPSSPKQNTVKPYALVQATIPSIINDARHAITTIRNVHPIKSFRRDAIFIPASTEKRPASRIADAPMKMR